MIILVGRKGDPHIEYVREELNTLGQEYVIIDTLFPINDHFNIKFDRLILNGSLKVQNKQFLLSDVKSIFYSSPLRINITRGAPAEANSFIRSEWTAGIETLWKCIPGRWVNHPDAIAVASNRLAQVMLAGRIGLPTPKTLVTNNPSHFVEFYEECGRNIIAKTLHSNIGMPEDKAIPTTKMSQNDIESAKDVQNAPCMFQEYIPKKTEFRITIVGCSIHAAEIYSQQSDVTKDDWRVEDGAHKIPYMQSRLPSAVEEKLLKLMKTLELNFGAIDMIRTPDDEFVFLEVNPTGRWAWIQNRTGMNIAKDIGKFLSFL